MLGMEIAYAAKSQSSHSECTFYSRNLCHDRLFLFPDNTSYFVLTSYSHEVFNMCTVWVLTFVLNAEPVLELIAGRTNTCTAIHVCLSGLFEFMTICTPTHINSFTRSSEYISHMFALCVYRAIEKKVWKHFYMWMYTNTS